MKSFLSNARSRPLAAQLYRRIRRDATLMAIDVATVVVTYLAALALRFDGNIEEPYWSNFWRFIGITALIHISVNHICGLYGRMWEHASVHEARRLLLAGMASGLAVVAVAIFPGGVVHLVPLSVAVLGVTLSLLGFGGVRFQSRLFAVRRRMSVADKNRVLLVGAGEAGAMVLRDIQRHPQLDLDPVGFIDDDPKKLGLSIRGVQVVGRTDALPDLIRELQADEVLLTIPSAPRDLVQEIAALCEVERVTLRVLPSVSEIVGGRVSARDIRDLRIEDLLGREQIQIDMDAIRSVLAGKRILVTGAGGSIGREICRQIQPFEPGAMILLDHDETHLHDILIDIPSGHPLLVDIRHRDRVADALARVQPDVVFHAAALKHVPLLEENPEEAFRTNVLGTLNVAKASMAAGVTRFVLISTDKAVKPVSVMGCSKRLAEWVVWALSRQQETFCAVRFGNVLGSRGSVVPTFLQQISRGGPVTVTDPHMTRYFMSIQEAVRLVLQAGAMARGGEIFTLDMGEPINILDLARKIIRLSGRVPDKDITIEIVGPRPGEKMNEDLVDDEEGVLGSVHPAIFVSRPSLRETADVSDLLDRLTSLADGRRSEELRSLMREVVSGHSPSSGVAPALSHGADAARLATP